MVAAAKLMHPRNIVADNDCVNKEAERTDYDWF
jgi:hypothetical protein